MEVRDEGRGGKIAENAAGHFAKNFSDKIEKRSGTGASADPPELLRSTAPVRFPGRGGCAKSAASVGGGDIFAGLS